MLKIPDPWTVDALTARSWHQSGHAVLLDVREAPEYQLEHIPGAMLYPLSYLEPAHYPRALRGHVVLVCQQGERSLAAGRQLLLAGIPDLYSLAGGLDGWIKAGMPVEGTKHDPEDYSI